MPEFDYKALLHRFTDEAWNKGELGVLDEALTENFVYHDPMMPDISSAEGYKNYAVEVRSSYPDFHMTIEEMIQEGNTLVSKGYWEGTQLGASPAFKIPATGKKLNIQLVAFAHVAEGKIIEMWMYQDWAGIMRQLGLLPSQ